METRIFPAKTEELDNVLDFVNGQLEAAGCDMKSQTQISIALEELFVNVAHYAYKAEGAGGCEIGAGLADDGMFNIRIKDLGIPFDPTERDDPDITLSAEERQIGGLGIFMVKKFMDKVTYERDGDYNIMTIGKKIK